MMWGPLPAPSGVTENCLSIGGFRHLVTEVPEVKFLHESEGSQEERQQEVQDFSLHRR